jgi:hypothetical protein
MARLEPVAGQGSPEVWSSTLRPSEAPGLLDAMARCGPARLDDLGRSVSDRAARLACLPLMLARGPDRIELPPGTTELRPGDALLFAGRAPARRAMQQTLLNANTAEYVLTGRDRPSSVLARLLDRARPPAPSEG